jgi:UDP-N-acetylmuramoylalanine--D-glutamate ligase
MANPTPVIDLDGLTLGSFAGRRVAVLGLARSGIALARFLSDRGAEVTIYDALPAEALREAIAALGERRPRLLLGPDIEPRLALRGQSLICTSPSVSSRFPTTEPRLRAALAEVESAGVVPIVSEVDLFLRLCPARTVGVTGTKGKTTTSSLTAAVLAGAWPVLLGGNIGRPLIERVSELTGRHRVVVELSELQLPTLSRGTEVAVYTHVTADHIDRHGDLASYQAVKRRLVDLLPRGGALVRNDDDPVVSGYQAPEGRLCVPYARRAPGRGGLGVQDGWVVASDVPRLEVVRAAPAEGRILPLDEIGLPGEHNLSNVLAATAVGLLHGVAPEHIRSGVRDFGGVEHRLEQVATIDGVRYVNDSQGTQPDAVIAALRSFDQPLVLIAGGRSKHVPIDELARVAAERASAAVLIGESAPELAAAFASAGLAHIQRAASMQDAVQQASEIARAQAPAVVLLSPAAASFDMFRDYEDRGAAFKAAVADVATASAGSATGAGSSRSAKGSGRA